MKSLTFLGMVILCTTIGGHNVQADAITVGDQTFDARVEGEGQAVIFVHGAISDRRVWDSVIDAMPVTGDRRYVAYTQRHFGPGEGPFGMPVDFRRDVHVDDLIALADSLGGDAVSLVTWSYGGQIGLHAMMQRPDLFRAAIHYEPILFPLLADLPGGKRAFAEKARTVFAPAVALAKSGDLNAAALRFIEGVFLMEPGSAADAVAPWPQIWRDNSRTIPAYGAMAELPVTCSDLSHISAPMLVLKGTKSQIDNAMMADEVSRCSGNVVEFSVQGINHDMPMIAPKKFADLIDAFLVLTN